MTFAGSLFQSVLRRTNPYLVPAGNRRLEQWALAHPAETVRRIQAAIGAGIGYFERQSRIDLAALVLLGRLNGTGSEPRLGFIERRIAAYSREFADSHLRLLDPSYVPPTDIATKGGAYDNPVLQLMIRCLYADRNGDGAACLQHLAQLGDAGGYETTHVAIGALILRDFGAATDDMIEPLIRSIAGTLIAAQRFGRADDLFAERIAVLQWLDRHASVELAWMLRLVNAQRGDGGWTAGPSLRVAKPNQHTSALALVSLIQWAAHGAGSNTGQHGACGTEPSMIFWRQAGAR